MAALAASGCVGLSAPEIGPATGGSRPLQAYLYAEPGPTGGLIFDLNRPAHVAVFQVVPGRGSALVYPRPGYASANGASFAGLRRVPLRASRGDYYGFLPPTGAAAGPEFYLLVASEEPLRLENFGPYGSRLQSAMGVHFASMNAYGAMEQLVSAAVPNPESGNWTTDFYVHWPETLHHSPGDNLIMIRCGDYVAYVPRHRAVQAANALCPSEEQTTPEGTVPGDSTQTVQPIRRPPVEPSTDRITSTQLERPDEWLVRRRAAEDGRSLAAEEVDRLSGPEDRERLRGSDDGFRRNPAADDSRRSGIGSADRRRGGDRGSSGSAGADRRPSPPPAPRAEPRSGSGSSGVPSSSPPPRTQPEVSPDNLRQ